MKSILLLLSLFLVTVSISAQESKKYTYLIVRVVMHYERSGNYCTIQAEPGNKFADEIYGLVPFKPGKYYIGQPSFYQVRSDTSKTFYNCFVNTTEALTFLSERKWELLSVSNEIYSTWDTYNDHPYTKIGSIPVYYFRKMVD
jgi:hypothetical protein